MLNTIWSIIDAKLDDACDGFVGLALRFDGASFRKAASSIVAGGGYTNYAALRAKVGKEDLDALIKYDLIAVRPKSAWARDLPEGAFGATTKRLATAVSATALFCMRKLQAEGRLTIEVGPRCRALLPPPPPPLPPCCCTHRPR